MIQDIIKILADNNLSHVLTEAPEGEFTQLITKAYILELVTEGEKRTEEEDDIIFQVSKQLLYYLLMVAKVDPQLFSHIVKSEEVQEERILEIDDEPTANDESELEKRLQEVLDTEDQIIQNMCDKWNEKQAALPVRDEEELNRKN